MNIQTKARKAGKFIKENKILFAQLAVMGTVALMSDPAFASTTDSSQFRQITGPLQAIRDTIKGPVATAVATIGAGLLGVSVAANFENQAAKRGVQVAGGAGLAVGAGGAIDTVATAGSGLLMLL